MKEEKVKISGMTCTACASRVERVMNKLEGVDSASVNFATETLSIKYDNEKLNSSDIEKAVEKAGYSVEKKTKSYSFKVEGMTCSA
ncbi:heavy metal translocating P-type ATPase, partial [Clostridium perfringens]